MKKVLILELRSVCYQSYFYFAKQLGTQLKKFGCAVTFFRTSETPFEQLEQFCDSSFDAVFDFNSKLPQAKMEDDSYFLDHINAPFFDIILDHPLYHHESLKQTLSNFHVLCLDYNHQKYVKENYPHIQSVHQIFLSGEESIPVIPMHKRPIEILFTGTYTSSNEVIDAIHHIPSFFQKDIKNIIDMMLADPALTIENAAKKLISQTDSLLSENFPLHVSSYFLADTYLRSYYREELIKTIANSGLPLTVYGSDWEKFPLSSIKHPECITFHAAVPFSDTFALMGQSKITLNLMPLFQCGFHDRIASAMLNHSVCVTDETAFLKQHYTNKKELLFFNLKDFSLLPDLLADVLSNQAKAEQIAANGYAYAKKHTSWKQIGQTILTLIS